LQDDANIPKKLKETDSIELTLAIKKTNNKLVKLSDDEILLYSYLPTDEKRYKLPILVNTTFLTSANRESLHADSKWNQWLFKSISLELFKWIAELVQKEYSYQVYNLIPNKLNVNDDLSKAYNKGVDEAIKSIPFILSKENTLLKVNQSIMDKTKFSEKDFIGSEIIKNFMMRKIGETNQIVDNPFIPNINIPNVDISTFKWDDVSALFAFDDFKSDHAVEKNIQLIKYLKNESETYDSNFPKDVLNNWAFILDHKEKLNYPNKVCFPRIDDNNWNTENSDLDYVNEKLYDLVMLNHSIKKWLENLGVQEKTDISYLNTVILPNVDTYITMDNYTKTIKYLYGLHSNEDIKSSMLAKLSKLKLLTTKGSLINASKCYFSSEYKPKLDIENILNDDIFLSKKYLDLDTNKDKIKQFFQLMEVQENIKPNTLKEKISNSDLKNNFKDDYFKEYDKKFQPFQSVFTADEYSNLVFINFFTKTNNYNFSKLFWKDLISNNPVSIVNQSAQAYWGHENYLGRISGDSVDNYPKWYIKNNKCLATTKEICEKSTDIFLNTKEIKEIAGKYLSVFDGEQLTQEWKSFFKFKTQLELNDYLELLTNIISDKEVDNKKRIQLVYKALLGLSTNWGVGEIEKVKIWSKTAFLTDEDENLILCSKLKYYADGDNSIFQNIHNFISLNEENKSHNNIEIFLGYLDIEILRQDNFDIDLEGIEMKSNLKNKLEEIFPYLEKWIKKLEKAYDTERLLEEIYTLQINEVSKLSLTYNGNILKIVQAHIKENKLLVTHSWSSNISMLELPKTLCKYLNIKGYEDKLAFLLKADDKFEIIEYFKNEEIELPVIITSQKNEKTISKESDIITLGTTEKEYDEIKKISKDFYHTSEPSIDKLQYIQKLLKRSQKRVLEHLNNLDEYDCKNVGNSSLTVLSGITKYGHDIYIISRPSDGGKVILYYDSEFDTLEYSDSDLWYEDGISKPK
jgi:hypothetical protein